jgi:hypothetical protein
MRGCDEVAPGCLAGCGLCTAVALALCGRTASLVSDELNQSAPDELAYRIRTQTCAEFVHG